MERSFARCVHIPKGIRKDSVQWLVNGNGKVSIKGKQRAVEQATRRTIPITYKPSTQGATKQ